MNKPVEADTDTSMAAIAASLLKPAEQSPTGGQEEDNAKAAAEAKTAVEDEQQTDTPETNEEEDLSPTGGQEEEELEETSQEEEEELEETSQEEEEDEPRGNDDDLDFLDITDADLIVVPVDGEEVEVSIGDLKKSYSANGAIEARLQEATETRNQAHAERTVMMEKLAANEQMTLAALENLGEDFYKPVVSAPPEELKRTKPDQYLRHQDAYQQDQERIAKMRDAVKERITAIKTERAKRLSEYADDAAKKIATAIPELADPKTGTAYYEKMTKTAIGYGYTPQEVQMAMDPRMFLLVRDAMLYRELKGGKRMTSVKDLPKTTQANKVRRLRSGNTSAKARVVQADKQRQAAAAKARQTGKPNDVAATLLVSKKS